MKYKKEELKYNLKKEKIDYFSIKEKYFSPKAKKELVQMKPGEYLDRATHLSSLNFEDKETVVLNFQVGKGKTSLCYDLMEEYFNNGYYIIVCSPFKRLVDKDYEEMSKRLYRDRPGIKNFIAPSRRSLVCNYNNIGGYSEYHERDVSEVLPYKYNIHIMTINTFMGNPGEDSLSLSIAKQKYLRTLWKLIKKENEKVVLFFDEVQESVYNFKSEYIPHVLKWNGQVEKVFISSASFTPATIPMIKALSLLTDRSVHIFESVREKNKVQSNISLTVCAFPLHSKENQLLNYVKELAEKYNGAGQPINVITGTKSLADSVAVKCYQKNIIDRKEQVKPDTDLKHVHLLTGNTDIPYQEGKNNIGTTFKAGINITSDKVVVIIIFPTINSEVKYKHYGIFSDGISSMTQAIGRQRNGGDIHLIMSEPYTLLGAAADYPSNYSASEYKEHLRINDAWDYLQTWYANILKRLAPEIKYMESEPKKTSMPLTLQSKKQQLSFYYYNQHEYFLKYSQKILLSHPNESFGRNLSPYIMWCCIHNQFINASLTKVYKLSRSGPIILTLANAKGKLQKILDTKISETAPYTFRESLNRLNVLLATTINKAGETQDNAFIYNGKHFTASLLLNRNKDLNRLAVEALFETYFKDEKFPDDKTTYLNTCLSGIRKQPKKSLLSNKLVQAYLLLSDSQKGMTDFIEANKVDDNKSSYIQRDLYKAMPQALFDEGNEAVKQINETDKILKENVFSFLQNYDFKRTDSNKKKILSFFLALSYSIGNRKTIHNIQYYELIKVPSSKLAGINILK